MSISITRYVQIASSVSGANSVRQQAMVGRLFTDNPVWPINKVLQARPGDAENVFGASSIEAAFARQYFGYVAPGPAGVAETLQIVSVPIQSRPSAIYATNAGSNLAELKLITAGKLTITIAGNLYNITAINLSSSTDMVAVATALTTKISASSGANPKATITYNATKGLFVATNNATGPDNLIITMIPGGDVNDLAPMLALTTETGAYSSPGSNAQTPLEAFMSSEQIAGVGDSFGSATFLPTVTLAQAKDLSAYVSAQNVKYQIYYPVASKTVAATWQTDLKDYAGTGLVLEGVATEYKRALPMAIMAATDYDRTNATVSYMYRQSGGGLTADVTSNADADALDAIDVNYYGQTATAGQDIAFFQRGRLMGVATSPRDMNIHANEQWLKAYLRARIMSLFLGVNKVPANLDGAAMVAGVVQGGIDAALNNGTIMPGKELTDAQKVAILQITADPLAWYKIRDIGYWVKSRIVLVNTDYVCKYTLVYSKGDTIRKVEGSHNLI